jgi:hypothetical protein
MRLRELGKAKWVVLVALASFVGAGAARADIVYSSPRAGFENGVPFYDDGTPGYPGGPGIGNTITLAGTARLLTTIDVAEGNEGGNTGDYTVTLYSGSDPNTGSELGSVTIPGHSGINDPDVFDFTSQDITLPNTITFIVSSGPGGLNGVLSGSAPTTGSAVDSIWYGSPGSYVPNNTFAFVDSGSNPNISNYLEVTVNAVSAPDGGTTLALLGLVIAGTAGLRRKLSL